MSPHRVEHQFTILHSNTWGLFVCSLEHCLSLNRLVRWFIVKIYMFTKWILQIHFSSFSIFYFLFTFYSFTNTYTLSLSLPSFSKFSILIFSLVPSSSLNSITQISAHFTSRLRISSSNFLTKLYAITAMTTKNLSSPSLTAKSMPPIIPFYLWDISLAFQLSIYHWNSFKISPLKNNFISKSRALEQYFFISIGLSIGQLKYFS